MTPKDEVRIMYYFLRNRRNPFIVDSKSVFFKAYFTLISVIVYQSHHQLFIPLP